MCFQATFQWKSFVTHTNGDRQKLQAKLLQCIDPLSPVGHSTTLFNIHSGKLADSSVNVHNALQLGKVCMQGYENKLPRGLYDTISSPLVTMATSRKESKLGQTSTVNTEVIFNRTLGIIGSGEFDLRNLFSHELEPSPTTLFQNIFKAKQKTFLQVDNRLAISFKIQIWECLTVVQYFGPYIGQYLARSRPWQM